MNGVSSRAGVGRGRRHLCGACLVASLLGFLAACTGSTGAQGPAGATGATGPAGPPGPSATVTALKLTTATQITATITSVMVPAKAPIQPVVDFLLVDQNGEPLSGLTAAEIDFAVAKLVPAGTQLAPVPPQTTAPAPLISDQWQSYIYTSASPAPASAGTTSQPVIGTTAQPQATVEAGTAGKLVDNGNGTYQYTFNTDLSSVTGVSYDATLTHRVGFEIRGVTNATSGNTISVNSPVYTFQPSTGATADIAQYDIVDDQDCKSCHQVLQWHGGARTEIQYCVMCHNPSSFDPSSGNTIDFKVMFHKIHMGQSLPTVSGKSFEGATVSPTSDYYIFGYGNSINDYATTAATIAAIEVSSPPTSTSPVATVPAVGTVPCGEASGVQYYCVDYPQADASNNNTTVSGPGQRFCVTCHNASDPNTPQAGNFASAPSAAACGSCHDNVNFATGQGHSAANLIATDTQCATCHGPSSTIDNGMLQVVAAHQTPVDSAIQQFQYSVVSLTNAAPGQTPVATIKVTDPTNNNAPYDITSPTGPFQNASSALNVDVAWDTIDINNIGSGSATGSTGTPSQPITISFAPGTTPTMNADGSFTLAATTPIPATATGSGIASLEGRAVVALANMSGSGTTDTELGPQGDSLTFAITDATPTPRAAIVDIAKCDLCHRVLTLHGENRTNDISLCVSCHNPNATDIVQHTAASGACAVGTPDNPIDFKRLIHEIHASGDSYAYGTTGVTICSFGGRPTTFKVQYPSSSNASLANCTACHESGTYYPSQAANAQFTTIHANATELQTVAGDVAISPVASACSACHTSTEDQNHMVQNGGSFDAVKVTPTPSNPNGSPSNTETCSLCHDAGGVADVAVVHNLASFQ
jgi:OmcA/MtrC family decaheme c-type cytochrome